VIGLAVAIIVFEGGYSFDLKRFRPLMGGILRLSLIGGVITWILMTLLFLYVALFPIGLAMLCGVLCGITGPTVINPIVRQLGIKEDVGGTLEGEGLLNDALSVIVVSVIFGAILAGGFGSIIFFPIEVAIHLGLGVAAGLGVGGLGIVIARFVAPSFYARFGSYFDEESRNRMARIGALLLALLAYSFGEVVAPEAGIMAALLAGILLGNRHMLLGSSDGSEEAKERGGSEAGVHAFQVDLTMLAIGAVFILLASLVNPILLIYILFFPPSPLPSGLIVVAALILLVRPVSVLVATIGSGFTLRERIFMSFLGPRGIVIASTSIFIYIEFLLEGIYMAPLLPGYIFLIVFATVILEGGLAPLTAKLCGVTERRGT